MLARKLTLDEASGYEDLTEESLQEIRANPEEMDLMTRDTIFHTN